MSNLSRSICHDSEVQRLMDLDFAINFSKTLQSKMLDQNNYTYNSLIMKCPLKPTLS